MKSKPVFMSLLLRVFWAAAVTLLAFGAQASVVFTSLHSFQVFPNGANPEAGLVQGRDGNFYGTTYAGGTNGGLGTVFKIGSAGSLTTLYTFGTVTDMYGESLDGAGPEAGLVQGSDGYFYGTTYYGGTNNSGTVFQIGANGAFTSLYSFTGYNDGANPYAGLVQGSDGNFYGTTYFGGTNGDGTVFQIGADGVLTTLYAFGMVTNAFGRPLDGAYPEAGLVLGNNGNFYGTTYYGGTNGDGTVFQISTTGELTTLYTFGTVTNAFGEPMDGVNPEAGLVQGSDGNFYGTTYGGGTNDWGTVFQINTQGTLISLYSFTGGNDGAEPEAGLMLGSDGNLYGTTYGGGTNDDGTVFQISTHGALTSLYSFTGIYSAGPNGLVQGGDGSFYGTTGGGGTYNPGTVFKISPHGALTNLYSFTGGNDGAEPEAGLVQGSDGNFYGTTLYSGSYGSYYTRYDYDYGTVFKISTAGMLTSLYSFTNGDDGAEPEAGLVHGSDGNFYGTTYDGGTNGYGNVFQISTNGALTEVYSFSYNDGAYPEAGLVQGSDGDFYGTTEYGGAHRDGTVFQINPNGTLTTLYAFGTVTNANGDALDGAYPEDGLVQGSDGNFYGTTYEGGTNDYGTVFQISTHGALTSLYSFTYGNDGAYPVAGLVQGSDGNFYGTTYDGGTNYSGTVFQISTHGALTSLYSFTGGNDGAYPKAGLVLGSDGNFYGTTFYGGTDGNGTVFQIATTGALTSLYSFTGGNDGGQPEAGLVQGSDGSFYGTTQSGGQGGEGTVFRLTATQSALVFQAVALTSETLRLTWSTEPGGVYQLQYTSDLSASNWVNLSSAFTATGTTLTAIDTVASGLRRFYRVALLP
jgi:uncharacterized repeat protein (TIGR03803 family)